MKTYTFIFIHHPRWTLFHPSIQHIPCCTIAIIFINKWHEQKKNNYISYPLLVRAIFTLIRETNLIMILYILFSKLSLANDISCYFNEFTLTILFSSKRLTIVVLIIRILLILLLIISLLFISECLSRKYNFIIT